MNSPMGSFFFLLSLCLFGIGSFVISSILKAVPNTRIASFVRSDSPQGGDIALVVVSTKSEFEDFREMGATEESSEGKQHTLRPQDYLSLTIFAFTVSSLPDNPNISRSPTSFLHSCLYPLTIILFYSNYLYS